MDSAAGVLLIVIVIVIALCWSVLKILFDRWPRPRPRRDPGRSRFPPCNEDRQRPDALQAATLFASEATLRCRTPVPLVARLDQLYLAADGSLILTETKTRQRAVVYERDLLQLSATALVLRHTADARYRRSLQSCAFIRIETPHGVVFESVTLWSESQVVLAYYRYQSVACGEVTARYAKTPGLCAHCGHRARCERPAA